MTSRVARYRADRPGRVTPEPGTTMLPFGAFCLSPRMQRIMDEVALEGKAVAITHSPEGDGPGPRYRDSFRTRPGKPLKIKGLSRVTAMIENTSDKAPAIEFGSGRPSEGASSGDPRPQGGSNRAMHPLGRAGREIGDVG